MIQTLVNGLYDTLGIDRAVVKKERVKKQESQWQQLSIFDVLHDWAVSQLQSMKALLFEYLKELKQLENPFSPLSKLLKSKRNPKLIDIQTRHRSLITDIAWFAGVWGLL